ncbi:hypothetical protein HDU84_003803 [Entophlyctis sp. JEL0112]|nr:hypothetical protein HDU84_003803 [Entophlyctis sp. JEL0112]
MITPLAALLVLHPQVVEFMQAQDALRLLATCSALSFARRECILRRCVVLLPDPASISIKDYGALLTCARHVRIVEPGGLEMLPLLNGQALVSFDLDRLTPDLHCVVPFKDSLRSLFLRNISHHAVMDPLHRLINLRSLHLAFKEKQQLVPLQAPVPLDLISIGSLNLLNSLTITFAILPTCCDALSNLTNLMTLCLRKTNFSDLSIVSRMDKLKQLDVGLTHVSDIRPLQHTRHLKYLSLEGCFCDNYAPLSLLFDLEYLVSELGFWEVVHLQPNLKRGKVVDCGYLKYFK